MYFEYIQNLKNLIKNKYNFEKLSNLVLES